MTDDYGKSSYYMKRYAILPPVERRATVRDLSSERFFCGGRVEEGNHYIREEERLNWYVYPSR